MERAFPFCGLPHKTYHLHQVKSQLRGIQQNTPAVSLKIVNLIKSKKDLRRCPRPEVPKEIRLNAMWYLGWDPGTEKGR